MSALGCKDFDERLLDYLYEELPQSEAEAVEAHLASCGRCRAEVDSFRRVRHAAREMPLAEPSPGVTARLLEAAQQQASQPPVRAGAPTDGAHLRLVSSHEPTGRRGTSSAATRGMPSPHRGKARRLARFLRHPSLAVAASFLVVGVSAAYFLTFHRTAVLEPPRLSAQTGAAEVPAPPVVADTAPGEIPPPEVAAPPPRPAPTRSPAAAIEEKPAARSMGGRSVASSPSKAAANRKGKQDEALVPDDVGDLQYTRKGGMGGSSAAAGFAAPTDGVAAAEPRARASSGERFDKNEQQALAESAERAEPRAEGRGKEEELAKQRLPLAQAPAAPPRAPILNAAEAKKANRRVAEADTRRDGLDGLADVSSSGAASARGRAPAAPTAAADERAALPQVSRAQGATGATGGLVGGDARSRLAEFRAYASGQLNCNLAIERYSQVKALEPAYRFSDSDRWDAARCLGKLGRYGQARVELHALRDDAPAYASRIDQLLAAIAQEEQVMAKRQRGGAQAPTHAAPKRVKAAPSSESDQRTAPAD